MKKIVMFLFLLSSIAIISCEKEQVVEEKKANITLTLAMQEVVDNPAYKGYIAFAEKLSQISGGTMNIEIVRPDIPTASEQFDSVSSGKYDILAVGYTGLTHAIPEFEFVNAPYILKSYEHFLRLRESEFGKNIIERFDNLGMVASGGWYIGTRQVTSNKPINSIADFEGLRMSETPFKNVRNFIDSVGAQTVYVPFQKLYESLESGKIEAQDNPLSIIEDAKIHKLQQYIAMTDHIIILINIFINKDKYNTFTEEQKAWYRQAIEHGRQVCSQIVYEKEAELLQKFQKDYNMTVTYPDKKELMAAMEGYYAELESKFDSKIRASIAAVE